MSNKIAVFGDKITSSELCKNDISLIYNTLNSSISYPEPAECRLELLEDLLYKPESRRLATELIDNYRDAERVKVFTLFMRAVIQIYNAQYIPAKSTFREIRSKLGYHVSTRIRIRWLDEEGKAISSQGKISQRKNEKSWVKNIETGFMLPMDNHNYWEKLGKPNNIKFETGFSFTGPRALVTE